MTFQRQICNDLLAHYKEQKHCFIWQRCSCSHDSHQRNPNRLYLSPVHCTVCKSQIRYLADISLYRKARQHVSDTEVESRRCVEVKTTQKRGSSELKSRVKTKIFVFKNESYKIGKGRLKNTGDGFKAAAVESFLRWSGRFLHQAEAASLASGLQLFSWPYLNFQSTITSTFLQQPLMTAASWLQMAGYTAIKTLEAHTPYRNTS